MVHKYYDDMDGVVIEVIHAFSLHNVGSIPKNGLIGMPDLMIASLSEGRGVIAIPPVSENDKHQENNIIINN